jgi:hypothetical protein
MAMPPDVASMPPHVASEADARQPYPRDTAVRETTPAAGYSVVGRVAELGTREPSEPAETRSSEDNIPAIDRSQWERLQLGPDIELHVRRPLSRLEQRRVERLITIARQVLHEDAT